MAIIGNIPYFQTNPYDRHVVLIRQTKFLSFVRWPQWDPSSNSWALNLDLLDRSATLGNPTHAPCEQSIPKNMTGHMHTCAYIYIYTYIHICIYIYIFIHDCICMSMLYYIYVSIMLFWLMRIMTLFLPVLLIHGYRNLFNLARLVSI